MNFISFRITLSLMTFFFLVTASVIYPADKISIYMYSSEANINNYKSLKMEFDGFLSKHGDYEFQPFSEKSLFETNIKGKEHCLILLSSWHFVKIHRELALKPILSGVRNGNKYQKRIYVTSVKFAETPPASRAPVASASSEDFTRSVLKEVLPDQSLADTIRILTVPKDVDALMSVGFEISKSAVTSVSALDNLKKIDPVLFSKMKIIGEGKESLMLVIAAPAGFVKDMEQLIQLIKNMSNTPEGKNVIKMLDLDDWQEIDAVDLSKLGEM